MRPYMCSFSGSIRQRNCMVKGNARFFVAAELHQQRAFHAVEVKVAGQRFR